MFTLINFLSLRSLSKALFFFISTWLFCSCDKQSKPISFYYWRTVYQISPSVKDDLNKLDIKRIYLRFFDVVLDKSGGEPVPRQVVTFNEKPLCEVVPVVFIRNEVFIKTEADELSQKIYSLVKKISEDNDIQITEIQIDCDWTETTRDEYFEFLKRFKDVSNTYLSVTIRLHQIKYKHITGVPPCDKGVMMFYNMGSILPDEEYVFSEDNSRKYLSALSTYPLLLDPALPYFEQATVYRDGKPLRICKPDIVIMNDSMFVKANDNYIARSSFLYSGLYVRKGDIFKVENTRNSSVLTTARLLSHYLSGSTERILLYDLPHQFKDEEDISSIKKIATFFN